MKRTKTEKNTDRKSWIMCECGNIFIVCGFWAFPLFSVIVIQNMNVFFRNLCEWKLPKKIEFYKGSETFDLSVLLIGKL